MCADAVGEIAGVTGLGASVSAVAAFDDIEVCVLWSSEWTSGHWTPGDGVGCTNCLSCDAGGGSSSAL